MTTTWTLVLLLWTAFPRSESMVVPGFQTEQACHAAAESMTAGIDQTGERLTLWQLRRHWCFEVVR